MDVASTSELVTPREAARRLGVRVDTVHRWIRTGKVPAYKLGRRFTRINWPRLLEILEARDRRQVQ